MKMEPGVVNKVWKPIKGYEGYYEVSSCGLVRSNNRCVSGRNGVLKGRLKKTTITNMGYEQVHLYKNSKCKAFSVHRLVALHFVTGKGDEVNHIDGDKQNNNCINLEWTTRSENALHSTRILKKNIGEQNTSAKLTETEVREIKFLLEDGNFNQTEIGQIYDVTNGAIHRIAFGHNWSWVDEEGF